MASRRAPIGGKAERRRDEEMQVALAKLYVDWAQLEPKVGLLTGILENATGGMPAVIRAMRLSSDPLIVEFLRHYDGVNARDRKRVPFETFALQAGLNFQQLLGSIMMALGEEASSKVKVISTTSAPKVIRKTIEYALEPAWYKDREMLHKASGFLPIPKGHGPLIHVIVSSGMPAPDPGERLIPPEEIDMNAMFPDLMTTQKLLPDFDKEEKK